MTVREPIGLGVLGLGEGRSIMSAALSLPQYRLVTICDLNAQLCKERCVEFGFGRYTLSYDEMLAMDDIDVIAIFTPDEWHARHCIQAFDAGKHVICTKPLFDSLDGVSAVRDAARRSDRKLMVGQSSRFFEPMIRQRKDANAGRLGEIFTVEAHYHADHRWYFDKHRNLAAYKPLFGGLSHPVDLVRWYLGPIEKVFGYGVLTTHGRSLGLAHHDAMHFVLKSVDGRVGRVSGCYSTPPSAGQRDSHVTCVVRGVRGTSQADYPELRYCTHIDGAGETFERYDQLHRHYFRFEGTSHHAGEFANYLKHFHDALAAGIEPEPGLDEGIDTIATLCAMERSLIEGREVAVDEMRPH